MGRIISRRGDEFTWDKDNVRVCDHSYEEVKYEQYRYAMNLCMGMIACLMMFWLFGGLIAAAIVTKYPGTQPYYIGFACAVITAIVLLCLATYSLSGHMKEYNGEDTNDDVRHDEYDERVVSANGRRSKVA